MAEGRADDSAEAALDITVRTGSGTGKTPLAAFDAALLAAGVGQLNLVHLSSVIPRASRIRPADDALEGLHGDRLYCVYAEAHAYNPGETAWAGLGWTRDATGDGFFVEHVGGNRETVIEQIHLTLSDMTANRGGGYSPPEYALASAHWDDRPACAVVLAAYQVEPWGRA
jgi:arginine decarboxylase